MPTNYSVEEQSFDVYPSMIEDTIVVFLSIYEKPEEDIVKRIAEALTNKSYGVSYVTAFQPVGTFIYLAMHYGYTPTF